MIESIPLESVIVSSSSRRPVRAPDYQAENGALVWLVEEAAKAPGEIFQRLVEASVRLTGAQSAGVSLLNRDQGKFIWPAVAGVWEPYVWGGTPRDFGPCGTVLDRDCPLLFTRPERHFSYLAGVSPHIQEGLLVPFHVAGKAVGTIWVVVHDGSRQFDSEDERVLISLSKFTSAAYRTLADIGALKYLN